MASKFVQAFKQKEIRNKILFTLLIVFLYRIGTALPVPGIPIHDIADQFDQMNSGVVAILSLFANGALSNLSFLSLGVMPAITASIILQLMSLVIPKVAAWRKEGGEGRKQITKWSRFLTLFLALINAIGYDLMFQAQYGIVYPGEVPSVLSNIIVIFSLVIGAVVLLWMGELITQRGIGQGLSVLIFTSVASSIPAAFVQSVQTGGEGLMGVGLAIIAVLFVILVLPVIVEVERAQRRVPIKSTKAGANSMYARSSETNYIPVPVNIAGLYAIIFASSFTMIPVYLAAWFTDVQWLQQVSAALTSGWVNWIITAILVIFFCFFMAGVNFDSDNIADNLKKQGSYVQGVRPGKATADYFRYIVNHITLFGAIYVAVIAVGSSMLFFFTNNQLLQAFGGTSIFILVSSSIMIMSAIEQQIRSGDPEAVLRRLGR